MLNILWLLLILISIVFGILNGKTTEVVIAVTNSAKLAVELALGLAGIMVFWLGLMRIASDAGIIHRLARLLKPGMQFLFPEIPPEHPAMGAILFNIVANMLGLANAATPFGLKAMEELATLNSTPGIASNAMCMFLAVNTSSVQLIPVTAIAYLAAAGAMHPTQIIITALLATACSTLAAIIAAKLLAKFC